MHTEQEQIQYLKLDQVVAGPQVREVFSEESEQGLMQSTQEVGQLQPIRVRQVQQGKFVIVDGERRYRVALKAKWPTIAAIIENKELTPGQILLRQIIANCQREDLKPVESARAIRLLMSETGWNASQVALHIGKSASTLTRRLALLSLPDALQDRVDAGEIAESAAYELARVEDPGERGELADRLAAGSLTRDALAGNRKAARKSPKETVPPQVSRASAILGSSRSVTVAGNGLTLDRFIELIEEVLAKARRARAQGVELATFTKMLKDQSRSA